MFIFSICLQKKYHTPGCSQIKRIAANNKLTEISALNGPEKNGYSACGTCKADSTSVLLGDSDTNSTVSVADARTVLRFAIQLDTYTDIQLVICDTDISGDLTVADARTILRISVGLE